MSLSSRLLGNDDGVLLEDDFMYSLEKDHETFHYRRSEAISRKDSFLEYLRMFVAAFQMMLIFTLSYPIIKRIATLQYSHSYFDTRQGSLMMGLSAVAAVSTALAANIWGYVTDQYGRKFSVIILCLVGSAAGLIVVGFSTQYWHLIVARIIGGFFEHGKRTTTFNSSTHGRHIHST